MPDQDHRPAGAGDILTIGFGTCVLMWGLGYACRLFGDAVPAPLVFVLLLGSLLAGGAALGRYTPRGVGGSLVVGLVVGLINLLIVGSLIGGDTPNAIRRGALLWVPGTLAVSLLLVAAGAAIGRARRPAVVGPVDWTSGFAVVAVAATALLLTAGGLVTGFDEGLAVVDWPNTEGYNMFLYPLSRMTGGVYLEHAHRLLGTLVGLATLVLAIHVQVAQRRPGVRPLAWTVLALVVVQGVLGGLRVTGRLTLSTQPEDTSPNIALAIAHGVLGQLVFAGLVALAVACARSWQSARWPAESPSARTDRGFGLTLVVLLIVQLVLGALVRHFTWALDIHRYGLHVEAAALQAAGERALTIHLTFAVIVTMATVAVGARAWGLHRDVPALRRVGQALLVLIAVQLALGIGALIVTGDDATHQRARPIDVVVTTAHQIAGAALLAGAVFATMWSHRRAVGTGAASPTADGCSELGSAGETPARPR